MQKPELALNREPERWIDSRDKFLLQIKAALNMEDSSNLSNPPAGGNSFFFSVWRFSFALTYPTIFSKGN
jgi:hypothetical protein